MKRRRKGNKRIVSILLTMCLVLSLTPTAVHAAYNDPVLYVGGAGIPEDGYWKENTGGGGYVAGDASDYDLLVEYSASAHTYTVTLNGISVTDSYYLAGPGVNIGFYCSMHLNLILADDSANTIDLPAGSPKGRGIYVSEDLNISGGGSLTVAAAATGEAAGMYVGGELTVSDGSLIISGASGGADGAKGYGVYVDDPVSITGGNLSASGDTGIHSTEEVHISGGELEAIGDEYGFKADDIHISGGASTLIGSTRAVSLLTLDDDISIDSASYKYKTNTEAADPGGSYTFYPGGAEYAHSATYQYIEIIETPALYIGGVNAAPGAPDTVAYWKEDGGAYVAGTSSDWDFSVEDASSGGVFILTLNGLHAGDNPFVYRGTDYGIYSDQSLDIVTAPQTTNTLELSGSDICGIYADGDIGTDGAGSFAVLAAADESVGSSAFGIFLTGSLLVVGGTLTVKASQAEAAFGLATEEGDIAVSGGTVAIGAQGDTGYGAYTEDGNITVSGGMVAIDAQGDTGYGTYTEDGTTTVSGGTVIVNVRGDTAGGILSVDGNITVSGGAVYAAGDGSAAGKAIFSTNGEIIPDEDFGKYAVIMTEFDGGTYTPTVLYDSDTPLTYVNAGLWTGGFPFGFGGDWSTTAGAIYGDYFRDGDGGTPDGAYAWSAEYDDNGTADSADDSCELTLHGVNIINTQTINTWYTGIDIDYAVFSEPALNMLLADGTENLITVTDGPPHYGIHTGNDLTVSGGGSLTVTTGLSDSSYGIHARGSLAVSGGAITAVTGEMGVFADQDVSISGGTVTTAAMNTGLSSYGIYAGSDVNISGGTVHTTADASTLGYGIQALFSLALSGGSTTAIGSHIALYYEEVNSTFTLPATHKYKSNTAASDPGGDYTYGTYPYSAADKYVEIAAYTPSPANNGNGGGGGGRARTITVVETSSGLFSGSAGRVEASADMSRAFSDSVEVRVTDLEEGVSGFGFAAGDDVYPFDISLYIRGTDTRIQPNEGYAVTVSLPVPESLLDRKEQLIVLHRSDDGTVSALASRLTQTDGVWYLVFEAAEFSPYAIAMNNTGVYDGSRGVPWYLDAGGNKVFIGFAANGKYIAPAGITVLFQNNGKSFSDLSGHWAAEYIGFVTEREIFLGTGAGRFSPDTGMTRAMFATVVGRLYERSYGAIGVSGSPVFADCDYDAYYGKYVDWAAENGVIGGYGTGRFGPEDPVTREQMAAILHRFAEFLGALPEDSASAPAVPDPAAALNYPDSGSIASWAKDAAAYCQDTGVITGRTGGIFAPRETATRAEVAAIVRRFVESVVNGGKITI